MAKSYRKMSIGEIYDRFLNKFNKELRDLSVPEYKYDQYFESIPMQQIKKQVNDYKHYNKATQEKLKLRLAEVVKGDNIRKFIIQGNTWKKRKYKTIPKYDTEENKIYAQLKSITREIENLGISIDPSRYIAPGLEGRGIKSMEDFYKYYISLYKKGGSIYYRGIKETGEVLEDGTKRTKITTIRTPIKSINLDQADDTSQIRELLIGYFGLLNEKVKTKGGYVYKIRKGENALYGSAVRYEKEMIAIQNSILYDDFFSGSKPSILGYAKETQAMFRAIDAELVDKYGKEGARAMWSEFIREGLIPAPKHWWDYEPRFLDMMNKINTTFNDFYKKYKTNQMRDAMETIMTASMLKIDKETAEFNINKGRVNTESAPLNSEQKKQEKKQEQEKRKRGRPKGSTNKKSSNKGKKLTTEQKLAIYESFGDTFEGLDKANELIKRLEEG